ncbi:hypothetical protein B0H13DRAFT_1991250, partial [Mycena leptocephala]
MSLSGFQGLSVLLAILLCSLAKYLIRRRGARRRGLSIRQPILGVEHRDYAIPFEERLPHFPAPELANMNTRDLAVLRLPMASPTILNRRQFHAPGSPNQQLLSPRMRQSAQRRLPYQYPLPPSLLSTPVLSFPATPPPSPTHDLELYRNRFNSIVCVDNPIPIENAVACPSSPFNSEFTARLLAGPPRSPLARTSQPAPESADVFALHGKMAQARLQHLTHMEPVLPVRLPSPGPAEATFPQLQTIPCDDSPQSIAFPDTSALPLLPSPILADRGPVAFLSTSSQPQRCVVRRCPSFPLPATPPSPVPESGVAASEARKPSTTKMIKRHSMVFRTFAPPSGSPVTTAFVPNLGSPTVSSTARSPEQGPPQNSKGCAEPVADGRAAEGETVEERFPLVDVHNTTPIVAVKQSAVELPVLEASQLCPLPSKHLAALISPSKVPRRVERGPDPALDPVYHYHPEAPAVAIAKSIVRPAQENFKNFSAALGARFGQKGWAATGPNELAPPPAKKAKKKKKKGITRGSGFSQPSSPIPSLLPAFGQSGRAGSPLLKSEMSRFGFDSTALETTSVEQIVTTGCHPNCADIYCPGGCSEDKC